MTIRPKRRGTVPLEFTILWPFLMLLAVLGWWAARAGMARTDAEVEARRQTWASRAEADAGATLVTFHDPLASAVEGEAVHRIPGRPPAIGELPPAIGRGTMTDRTWSFDDVPFDRLDSMFVPHRAVLDPLILRNPDLVRPKVLAGLATVGGFRAMTLDYPHERATAAVYSIRRPIALVEITAYRPLIDVAIGLVSYYLAEALASLNFGAAARYAEELRVLKRGRDAVAPLQRELNRPE